MELITKKWTNVSNPGRTSMRVSVDFLRRAARTALVTAIPLVAAGPVAAEPSIFGPTPTTSSCLMIYTRSPVSIYGSGISVTSPPAVDFSFWVYATGPCDARNVKVTWLYQTASKATKAIASTHFGSTTFKLLKANQGPQYLTVHCSPTSNTYCHDAAATLQPGNFTDGALIQGNATATVGPLTPMN
jgi:hypothetical protein